MAACEGCEGYCVRLNKFPPPPQLFPYHLADYVVRVKRLTPFQYYADMLQQVMKDEKSYDRVPNFTVRPACGHQGGGACLPQVQLPAAGCGCAADHGHWTQ